MNKEKYIFIEFPIKLSVHSDGTPYWHSLLEFKVCFYLVSDYQIAFRLMKDRKFLFMGIQDWNGSRYFAFMSNGNLKDLVEKILKNLDKKDESP